MSCGEGRENGMNTWRPSWQLSPNRQIPSHTTVHVIIVVPHFITTSQKIRICQFGHSPIQRLRSITPKYAYGIISVSTMAPFTLLSFSPSKQPIISYSPLFVCALLADSLSFSLLFGQFFQDFSPLDS